MPLRLLASCVLYAAALFAAPRAIAEGSALLSLACVAAGVLLATVASETRAPLAVALGALGAFAFALIAPHSPELGAGVLFACAYGARAARARTGQMAAVHGLTAFAAGLSAQWVVLHYEGGDAAMQVASLVVGAILVTAPSLLPADDAITHGLIRTAREVPEEARVMLLRAAMLRRREEPSLEVLPPRTLRAIDRAFAALLATAQHRARAEGEPARLLDKRITAHVQTLERVYAAAGEACTRATKLADVSLEGARAEGDALAAEAAALAEIANETQPPPVAVGPAAQ